MKSLYPSLSTRQSRFPASFALLFSTLLLVAGCGGGGMSLIAISPSANQTLDAGQSLTINASVVNDSTHRGASFSLSGLGTLTAGASYAVGDSDVVSETYTAPATVTASSTAVVTATSVNTPSQTASVTINLNSALAITTTTLPAGTIGTAYSATLTASGGTPAYKWAIASGALPGGISLASATGIISGTPTASGTFNFTVSLTDSASTPVTVTQAYTLIINAMSPTITATTLPNGTSGTAYSQQLTYSGGNGSTPTFTLASGALPPGLTLSTGGLISGTPTNAAAGNKYTFTVTVTVGTQTSAPATLSITVYALPVITTTSLPSGNIGINYSQQIQYSGGNGSTPTFAITSGSLPVASGLTLNTTTGVISGKPTSASTYNFSVAVTVGPQTSAAQAYTLVINSLVVTSSATASGEVSLPFDFHLTAAGGTAPHTWSLATGSAALPAGLMLNATTGVISGTPTTNAGSPYTGIVVKATDSLGATATQSMTFTIYPARANTLNSELKGSYAFLLSGFDANGKPLTSAGSFTADGLGNILSGSVDTNGTGLTTPVVNSTLLTATYAVGADNRGKLSLTTASGISTFVIALNAVTGGVANDGYMTEFDTSGNALTGVLALQTAAATVSGGYTLGLEGFAANSTALSLVHRAVVGETQFTNTGGFANAEFVSTGSGSATPIVPTTATLVAGANGRATLSYTLPSGGGKIDLVAYIVSASKFFLISADAASGTSASDLLYGQALQQTITNGNFSATSLSGISVMRSQKLQINLSGVNVPDVQVGLFTFNGAGKVSLASDENNGGSMSSDALGGQYTVSANGRVTLLLSSSFGGCADCVTLQSYFYLIGANQGFMLDFTTAAASGYFEPQTATTFTAASLSGSYSLGTLDPLTPTVSDVAASVTSTGTGNITGTTDQNSAGTLSPDDAIAATYVVGSTGRTPLNVNGTSGPVLYIVSTTKAIAVDLSSSAPVVEEIVH